MGLRFRLYTAVLAIGVLGASGCFLPSVLGGNELAAWDVRTCGLPGGGCSPYEELRFFTDGSFSWTAIAGNPLSGTWTDRGNGRITMTWRVPGILGAASADFQLSGGSTLTTATSLSGTQTIVIFGITETLPTEGLRIRP